ncbi:helix-turn-helix domain-containing protein [Arthrobacter sp. ISL-72]|uniref:helix-turn-helix domain-containing protein n=1 Tax=Arthrobacter sp. ISL-72 TaxID=2819114 RepID=UPI001BE501FC|nr:helix-turn-helix transcriptional regulator [Arthrobacter sp. ISL-72]MBT2594759.1 helix-turn-helix transcriptional regulator [Arthrobacter sp. ISL-72]
MSETVTERVAANVRAEAARLKMSQRDIAVALGVSQSSANRRYLGITPIDVEELFALANAFSVPVSKLLPEDIRAQAESA